MGQDSPNGGHGGSNSPTRAVRPSRCHQGHLWSLTKIKFPCGIARPPAVEWSLDSEELRFHPLEGYIIPNSCSARKMTWNNLQIPGQSHQVRDWHYVRSCSAMIAACQ